MPTIRTILFIAALGVCLLSALTASNAATIVILNADGPNEGFNDNTPVAPVGGNPGVTLGQQRLNAFQYAADLWGGCLQSNVTIVVQAQMNSLFCSPSQAVLGSAGATFVFSDFPGAPLPNTWYPQALAKAIAGVDLNPGVPGIVAQFNSNLNGGASCLGGTGWYYGFDQNPGGDIDFVSVVAHEIGHGLGFQTFVDLATGAKFNGLDDTYMVNLENHGAVPSDYPSMSDTQRIVASVSDPNLHWTGGCVLTRALADWTGGVSNGHPRMHGPNPQQGGSSVSHFSPAASPNEMMEPFYAGANHDVGAALQLMSDIGWTMLCPVLDDGPSNSLAPPPWWVVDVELSDLGLGDAFNVAATMSATGATPWLSFFDPNAAYGTILDGASSNGGGDTYALDLSGWPGGSFNVDLAVTWEDLCGNILNKTFSVALTPPGSPVTGIPEDGLSYQLAQNQPNPFNPTTEIFYQVPSEQRVTLTVYDVSGKAVRTLVDGNKIAGPHRAEWNGKDDDGRDVSSGVYFYRLAAGSFVETRRMVLLK